MVPTVIKSETQYREYVSRLSDLVSLDPELGTSVGDELELLALIVETYEKEKFRIERPTPLDAIVHRMHEQGLRQTDLVPYFGSRSRASEVLSGKRPLTISMIRALADGLAIPIEVLVGKDATADEADAERSTPLIRLLTGRACQRKRWRSAATSAGARVALKER